MLHFLKGTADSVRIKYAENKPENDQENRSEQKKLVHKVFLRLNEFKKYIFVRQPQYFATPHVMIKKSHDRKIDNAEHCQ